jgi:uncharacterized repeat protein (TIGR02543 family)
MGVSLSDFEVIELGWRPATDPAAATISWPTPAPIVQGKPLGPDELAATSSVPGSFVYDPPAGSVLPPGVHTLTATFIPASSALAAEAPAAGAASPDGEAPPAMHGPVVYQVDEMEAAAGAEPGARTATWETVVSVSLVVLTQPRTTPAIDWPAPAPIVQGRALSGSQLNASTAVPGTFVYAPAAGTVLAAGTHTLSAVFTPADTTLYNGTTAYMALTVTPVLHQLTVVRPTGGMINGAGIDCGTSKAACQVTMPAAMSLGLRATPDSGYAFAGWTGNCAGTNPGYSLTLSGSMSCGAAFTAKAIAPPANPATAPKVSAAPSPPPPGGGEPPLGGPYRLTVVRPSGGVVKAAGVNCGTKSASCEVTMPGPMTIGIQATADPGYAFQGWTGNCSGSSPSHALALEGPRSCGASFVAAADAVTTTPGPSTSAGTSAASSNGTLSSDGPYTLTITRPTGGTIQAAGIYCGTKGTACAVTMPAALWLGLLATPDRGYTFTGWTGDCSGTQPMRTVTLAGPRTCGATFRAGQ